MVVCSDGSEAWAILNRDDPPQLVILDWMMPEMDGVQVCRELRKLARQPYIYVILLTGKNRQEEVVEGLESGADDYIIKPFDSQELRVRVRAGQRVVELQTNLFETNQQLTLEVQERKRVEDEKSALIVELQQALAEVKKLSGFLPICASCKKIRDDQGTGNRSRRTYGITLRHSSVTAFAGVCQESLSGFVPGQTES